MSFDLNKINQLKEIINNPSRHDMKVLQELISSCLNGDQTAEQLLTDKKKLFERIKEFKQHFTEQEYAVISGVSNYMHKLQECRNEDARAVTIIFDWIKNHPFETIEPNDNTRSHKLVDVVRENKNHLEKSKHVSFDSIEHKGFYPIAPEFGENWLEKSIKRNEAFLASVKYQNTFVVGHDWYGALNGISSSEQSENHFRLPYQLCMFEFRMHGKSVNTLAIETDDDGIIYHHYIEFEKNKWYLVGHDDPGMMKATQLAEKQIFAICVALESQIAETKHISAGSQINKKRIKAGKTPLKNYHIVDLSKRYKTTEQTTDQSNKGERKSPRLHWRRGHWRKKPDGGKTYINWMLVGNVELGFIDKHYRI